MCMVSGSRPWVSRRDSSAHVMFLTICSCVSVCLSSAAVNSNDDDELISERNDDRN